ncbi:MAG: efflux RND transporter periplasmic adaptor subunit [Syntrophales bacterium]|jgi:multidrug efflux system membrane fusion protein
MKENGMAFFSLKRIIVAICLSSALTMFVMGCSSEKRPVAVPSVPVTEAEAIKKTVPIQIEAIGSVEAYQSISIRSQINALLTRVYFKDGQDVRKGDLLLKLDCRPYDAALKQSIANLDKDTAQLKNALEELHRYRYLVEKEYVPKEQYDQIQTNWAAQEATVNADRAFVENNRVQVQFCSIYSPVNGRMGSLKVNQGNLIKANDVELAVINQIQPINVTFAVPEKELPSIKKYMAQGKLYVNATIPGDSHPEKGILTFVDNAINKDTGTISLKATFANSEKRLWPGQFVNVTLMLTNEPDAIVIPSQAVEKGQVGQFVFVIRRDSTVEVRQITSGQTLQGETVVLEGVREGERVVTDGQMQLTPGARISIKAVH